MQIIRETLARLVVGAPCVYRNLAAFPLEAADARPPGYVTLDAALATGHAKVTEVSEAGSVPELLFDNGGAEAALLVDGEELVGARQNRILNLTLLVPPFTKVVIPVSCVEAGRWSYRGRHFASADHTLFARARAEKMRHVNMSLHTSGSRRADQGAIWGHVRDKVQSLAANAPNEAMADVFQQNRARLEDYVQAVKVGPRQVGIVFCIDGRVAGLELFDAPATLHALAPKLVRSYALDAIESREPEAPPADPKGVAAFLAALTATPQKSFKSLGAGDDLRLESEQVVGGALVHAGEVVHLAAFAR